MKCQSKYKMLFNPILFVISASLTHAHSSPCHGDKVITLENIKDIARCQQHFGSLTLNYQLSPSRVRLLYMDELLGDLILDNFRGDVKYNGAINGSLNVINQDPYNHFNLLGVEEVSSLVMKNVSDKMDFRQLKVTRSIQVLDSSITSITGLSAPYLKKVLIEDCPRLREFQIDGLKEVTNVKISNTSLKTFDFLSNVAIESDLVIEKYKYIELVIEIRHIGGKVTLNDNKLLHHIYFIALYTLRAHVALRNNNELRFIQFPSRMNDLMALKGIN
ncbi:hypothetical protein DSO57_1014600 [Entomophthora muscae]|uniref:Uncharacterized protein n=1 Tax=Entomophthora muscae TaxID=34485 RepID=A0ACC2UEP7_9FUNG|nr:hypothetical protein DSO57_1014600 [Entomophthora muscae]